ncbi:tRNA-queuosine alpha-mannosyltransferase domain-containing protein [Desulfomarina sp.]
MKRILVLEPYYGGSHKQFLDGLCQHVPAEYCLMTLPARKWKMRMQLAAPWYYKQISKLERGKRYFDTVLCSTFVDVGMLKGLLCGIEGWNPSTRFLTYFHENQFSYPGQVPDPARFQFTAINFNSGLVSDSIGFNTVFNYESFLTGCRRYVKKATDMDLVWVTDALRKKSTVLFPPIDFSRIDAMEKKKHNRVPVIVWNHRWEHDKNPEEFFRSLTELELNRIDFRLILLGQKFRFYPDCFDEAMERFKKKILHCGYVKSYDRYIAYLRQGDIVVSTAYHEFYGISVIEAVRAGCYPLLPDRLSYPELFGAQFLYGEGDLTDHLQEAVQNRKKLEEKEIRAITDRLSWGAMRGKYRSWLQAGAAGEEKR